MGQTSVPETLVIHHKLTPGYNPNTFKQHYDNGESLQLQHSSSLIVQAVQLVACSSPYKEESMLMS
jgi:hypothetical protein